MDSDVIYLDGEEVVVWGARGVGIEGLRFWMCIRYPSDCVSRSVGYTNSQLSGELKDGDINVSHGCVALIEA